MPPGELFGLWIRFSRRAVTIHKAKRHQRLRSVKLRFILELCEALAVRNDTGSRVFPSP